MLITPLYEPKAVHLHVGGPFPVKGEFKVFLYESENNCLLYSSDTKVDKSRSPKLPSFISSAYLQKRECIIYKTLCYNWLNCTCWATFVITPHYIKLKHDV